MVKRRSSLRAQSQPTGTADAPELIIASIQWPEGRTGVHSHIREFQRYLQSEGMPFTLLTPHSWGWPLAVPVFAPRLLLAKVHRSTSIAWYYYFHEAFLRHALRRRLAAGNPTVVYAQGPRAARAALQARQGPHQQVVMAVHFLTSQADEWVAKEMLDTESRVFRHIRQVESEAIAGLDGIVYVSEAARDALLEWLPIQPPARAAVVPNFVQPVESDRLDKPTGDLVSVGALELAKNHRYLLDVLAAAKQMGHRYTLDVFGEGPQRGPLLRRAQELGVSSQVRLMGFQSDVRAMLPNYRVYVHASYRESQGMALIEAMAAPLPIVAARCGGVSEVCDEDSGSRFWPLDDASQAASILIDLLDDDAELARATRRAYATFQNRFATQAIGPNLYNFLMNDPSYIGSHPNFVIRSEGASVHSDCDQPVVTETHATR